LATERVRSATSKPSDDGGGGGGGGGGGQRLEEIEVTGAAYCTMDPNDTSHP
jgi:hypothetical protein